MKYEYHKQRFMPSIVKHACFNCGGWIVGGSAKWLVGLTEEDPKDWDVIVPIVEWSKVWNTVQYYQAKVNAFGGFKIKENLPLRGLTVADIWPEDVGHFFMNATKGTDSLILVQPKTQQIIKCINNEH